MPNITIIKPGGARGTEAVANQQNQVEVVVTNAGGIEAVDAFVDAFFADPSTAFTPATATSIGADYLTIPAYSMRTITFPWTPTTADGGHRCLLARVALYIPPDAYANSAIFDVRGDRHVAQRNINIVSLGDTDSLNFSFAMVNPFPEPMQMRLVAQEIRDAKGLEYVRQNLGCGFAQFGETPLPVVKLDVGRERLTVREVENPMELINEVHRLSRVGLIKLPLLERPRNSFTLDMKPGEICECILYVERNPDTRPGDLHAINVIQQDANGNIIGGLTLVIQH